MPRCKVKSNLKKWNVFWYNADPVLLFLVFYILDHFEVVHHIVFRGHVEIKMKC